MSVFLRKENQYYYSVSSEPTEYTITKDYKNSDWSFGCFYVPQLDKIFALNNNFLRNFNTNRDYFNDIIGSNKSTAFVIYLEKLNNLEEFCQWIDKTRDVYFAEHLINIVANLTALYISPIDFTYRYENKMWTNGEKNITILSAWTKAGFERFNISKQAIPQRTKTYHFNFPALCAKILLDGSLKNCGIYDPFVAAAMNMDACGKVLLAPKRNYGLLVSNQFPIAPMEQFKFKISEKFALYAIPKDFDYDVYKCSLNTAEGRSGSEYGCIFTTEWIRRSYQDTINEQPSLSINRLFSRTYNITQKSFKWNLRLAFGIGM